MASIFCRLLNSTPSMARRWISKTQRKFKGEMSDPVELCTGKQKKEILAYMKGKCDPYHMAVIKRGSGTKENPTLIPSAFNGRIVGCICKFSVFGRKKCCSFPYLEGNDNRFVNFMWLEKGCSKRCECGHWYKLKEVPAFS